MKLKTFIAICLLAIPSLSVSAQEDVLQIVPTSFVYDGKTKVLAIEMNNSVTYSDLQFRLVLPEGISLANKAKPYGALPKNRFPYTEEYDELEDVTTTTFEHSVALGKQDNVVSIVISSNTLAEIKGNSGIILRLQVDLAENIKDGIYPIIFKEITLSTAEGYNPTRVAEAASYITVGTPELKGTVDLSALTGYLPKDVVTATTTLLADATDVTGIDLTGVSEAGGAVETGNPNALIYVKAETEFAIMQTEAGNNVVADVVCENLVLADNYPFATTKEFTAKKATYSRTVPAAGWYSLCLPFAADASAGVAVERFKSLDASASTVTFEAGAMEAYKPCIFKTENTEVTFTAEETTIAVTPTTLKDGFFSGTLANIPAGGLTGKYALRADGSGFGTCSATASSTPFRAFIDDVVAEARALSLIHDGETTGIANTAPSKELQIITADGMCTVKNGNNAQKITILSIDGRMIACENLAENETRSFILPEGIYLINNNKIIIK